MNVKHVHMSNRQPRPDAVMLHDEWEQGAREPELYVRERTCRNISEKFGNHEFTCEECGARVFGCHGEWFDYDWKYHKFGYCPHCGAKVVK